jgi:peptide/nickel transport system substrate-binding protein
MEQAVWVPYGNEQFSTFMSERMDFEESYHHLLFNQDFSSFKLK